MAYTMRCIDKEIDKEIAKEKRLELLLSQTGLFESLELKEVGRCKQKSGEEKQKNLRDLSYYYVEQRV